MTSAIAELQARGFVLHPLKGKIPLLQGWQKLTETPVQIEKHFEDGGNVGAVCGKVSDITVIDMDSFLFANDIFGAGVDTLKAKRTDGRGHFYFKYNPRLPASKHHDLGMEILSDGNNIVVPPSVHPTGDHYVWKNPDTPIIEMPLGVEKNLLRLFKTEVELKQILAKCRHCFRNVIRRKPDMHHAEGRDYMIAVAADMKAQGAIEVHICMFAKLMYDNKYDEGRTLQEWRNIDPAKTWTCETLRAKLPTYIDMKECAKCEERRQIYENKQDIPLKVIDAGDNTDVGNARRLVVTYGEKIRYCHPWKSWLCWNGKYWERDQTGQIYRYATQTIEDMIIESKTLIDELKDKKYKHAIASKSATKLKALVFLAEKIDGVAILPEQLDYNKMLFTVQNGTVDLLTGELRSHNPRDYITKISPATFDKNAKCEMWMQFLNKIMKEDVELIRYLQNFSGQVLTGEVREKRLYILYGKKDTGKTTFVETIAHILAEYAETMAIESLMKNTRGGIPNDIAALKGKRFVFVDEPDFGDKLSEGLIKKLTGQDTISARFLNEEFFKFKPEFKLAIAANNQPDLSDKDQAIWGRVKCVPFLYRIPPEEQDTKIQDKLKTEMSGILNWMIRGCLEWQKNGMPIPPAVQKASEEMKEDMDTLSDFFNVCCIKGKDYKIPHEYLYTAFRLWAGAVGRQPMSKKAFTQVCVNRDFERTDTIFIKENDTGSVRRMRGFINVSLAEWMLKSVHRFLTAPDSEKEVYGTVRTDLTRNVYRSQGGSHVCDDTMCAMRATCSGILNMCILPSVQSVQSVQYKEDIIITIKRLLDQINKPNSIKELEDLEEKILTELQTDYKYDNIDGDIIRKAIHDYFKVRGWE
jgi:putative DNA primase/helicase